MLADVCSEKGLVEKEDHPSIWIFNSYFKQVAIYFLPRLIARRMSDRQTSDLSDGEKGQEDAGKDLHGVSRHFAIPTTPTISIRLKRFSLTGLDGW